MLTDPPPDIALPLDEANEPQPERHLTLEQREDISSSLEQSTKGQVEMTAAPSDQEAVSFQAELAGVLEDSGFNVEIDNAKGKSTADETPPGVHATIANETFRPSHAYRVVHAFRRAGVAIATKINARLRGKSTLYIDVGPNETPPLVQPTSSGQSKSATGVIAKWKLKFAAGLQRPRRGP